MEATHASAISVHFTFYNSAGAVLTLIRLASSCGCTAAVLGDNTPLPKVLAPGASIPVTVTIDAFHLTPGAIDKTVSIYALGHVSPVAILHVMGTILPAVTFTPSTLDFGKTQQGQCAQATLSLTFDDGECLETV